MGLQFLRCYPLSKLNKTDTQTSMMDFINNNIINTNNYQFNNSTNNSSVFTCHQRQSLRLKLAWCFDFIFPPPEDATFTKSPIVIRISIFMMNSIQIIVLLVFISLSRQIMLIFIMKKKLVLSFGVLLSIFFSQRKDHVVPSPEKKYYYTTANLPATGLDHSSSGAIAFLNDPRRKGVQPLASEKVAGWQKAAA